MYDPGRTAAWALPEGGLEIFLQDFVEYFAILIV
jgi:hypothetical protein